jgi:hypothetical protein
MTIFDVTNNIMHEKQYRWNELKSLYDPYMINKILSMGNDTIFICNEMNMSSLLTKQMQYDFLYYVTPKKRRLNKYIKSEKTESDISIIMNVYNVSERVAKLYSKSLDKKTINNIEELFTPPTQRKGKKKKNEDI